MKFSSSPKTGQQGRVMLETAAVTIEGRLIRRRNDAQGGLNILNALDFRCFSSRAAQANGKWLGFS
jgi:hypothetical protein